jgi:hypothetical protein
MPVSPNLDTISVGSASFETGATEQALRVNARGAFPRQLNLDVYAGGLRGTSRTVSGDRKVIRIHVVCDSASYIQ